MFILRFLYRLIFAIKTSDKEQILSGFNIGVPLNSIDLYVVEGTRTSIALNYKKGVKVTKKDLEWQQYTLIRYIIFYDGIFWICNPVGNFYNFHSNKPYNRNNGERVFKPMFLQQVTYIPSWLFTPSLKDYREKLRKNNELKLHQYCKKNNIEKLINKI